MSLAKHCYASGGSLGLPSDDIDYDALFRAAGKRMRSDTVSKIPYELRGLTEQELNAPGTFINPRTGKRSTVRGDQARVPVIDGPIDGASNIYNGIAQMAGPNKKAGLVQAIDGTGQMLSPVALAAGITSPVTMGISLAGGMAAANQARKTSTMLGQSPEDRDLNGQIAGMVAGGKFGEMANSGNYLPLGADADGSYINYSGAPPKNPKKPIDLDTMSRYRAGLIAPDGEVHGVKFPDFNHYLVARRLGYKFLDEAINDGHVRYHANPGGELNVQINSENPKAVENAYRVIKEIGAYHAPIYLDAGYGSVSGSAGELLDLLGRIRKESKGPGR